MQCVWKEAVKSLASILMQTAATLIRKRADLKDETSARNTYVLGQHDADRLTLMMNYKRAGSLFQLRKALNRDTLPPKFKSQKQQQILNSSISLWMCFIFISRLMGLCCFCVPSCLHSVHVSVFDQRAGEPEESALEYIPLSQGNRSQILCKNKSTVKACSSSNPRCVSTVCFAVGEINNCGLRSGFSLISWPFYLSSSSCAAVYSSPQKTHSVLSIFGFTYFIWRLNTHFIG